MATTAKYLFRDTLSGEGADLSGNPKHNKIRVTAEVTVAYVTGGATLYAKDLGLATIDNLVITPVSVNNGTVSNITTGLKMEWVKGTGLLIATLVTRATGAETDATNAQNIVFLAEAFGDSGRISENF
jgi:hypothetical protein